jgi:hypothetical protein
MSSSRVGLLMPSSQLLPEADDILSLLEDYQLSAHAILVRPFPSSRSELSIPTHAFVLPQTSRIHEILKRMWLDGDCLLGDFADRYFLRARAMKLYKNWAARGLVATRWSVAPSVDAPMGDVEMRGDDMENVGHVLAKVGASACAVATSDIDRSMQADKGKGRAASVTPHCSDDEDDLVDTRVPHVRACRYHALIGIC